MNFPARLSLRWKEISALERLFVNRKRDGELEKSHSPNVNVWLKRDDRNEVYGGNKIRKLEYLLGDAQARGKRSVLTFGRIGSNHALATAVHAARHDMKAICVLLDQPRTQKVEQTLRWHLCNGTQLEFLPANATVADAEAVAERIISETDAYRIEWGGSMAVGSFGWVEAAFEVTKQLHHNGIVGDVRIYLPCGSMGTTAGLLLGLALARADDRINVIAVNILRSSMKKEHIVTMCATVYDEMARLNVMKSMREKADVLVDVENRLILRQEYFAPGYAISNQASRDAARVFASLLQPNDACVLDETYASKAFAALLHDVRHVTQVDADRTTFVFWVTCSSAQPPAALANVDLSKLPSSLIEKFF